MITSTKTEFSTSAGSHDEVIFPSSIPPLLQDALRRWAIPFGFNQEIALLLLDDLLMQKDSVWYAFLHTLNRGTRLPISYTGWGQFVFTPYTRDRILRDWQASDDKRAIYQRLNHLLYEYFEGCWQAVQAEQSTELEADESQALEFANKPSPISYLERSLYHHFASDAKSAFRRFEQLFEEYEWLNAVAVCDRLLVVAQAFEQSLSLADRFWLAFYQAKFHNIMAYSPEEDYQTRSRHRQQERQALESLLKKMAASADPEELQKLVAHSNMQLGNLAIAEDRFEDAIQHLEVAIKHFQQSGDLEQEVSALNNLGLVLMRQGHPDEAVQQYEAMRKRLEEQPSQDDYSLAVLLLNLGNAYAEMAEQQEAQSASQSNKQQNLSCHATSHFLLAFELFDKIEFDYGQGLALAMLGRWFLLRGEYDQAMVLFRAAQKLLPEDSEEYETLKQWLHLPKKKPQILSSPQPKAETWLQWGINQFHRGKFQKAIGFLEESQKVAHQEGKIILEFKALAWLSAAWCHLPDSEKAVESATNLLAAARQEKNKAFEVLGVLRLCEAIATIDLPHRWQEIRPLLLEGLTCVRHLADNAQTIRHLARLGRYAVAMGELENGLTWLQEALNNTERLTGANTKAFYRYLIHTALANLMHQRGNHAEAMRYAEIAFGEAHNHGNPFFIAEAELTLAQMKSANGQTAQALNLAAAVQLQAKRMEWRGIKQRAKCLLSRLSLTQKPADSASHSATHTLQRTHDLQMPEAEVTGLIALSEAMRAADRADDAENALQTDNILSQEQDEQDHFHEAEERLASLV